MLGYTGVAASAAEQRLSLDRQLTSHGWERAVMETSKVSGKRLGWAFTRQAQYLAYAMPAHSRVWVFPLLRLRELLPDWLERYPKRVAPNKGYTSQGILVPLKEFDAIALRVYLFTQT